MEEMVYSLDLKSNAFGIGGSNPSMDTWKIKQLQWSGD